MNEQFLEYGLRLLILQYGRQRVLRTIARLGGQTPEELDRQLQSAGDRPKEKRPKPSMMELVASECRGRPDIEEPLRILAMRLQDRTFLPHLRDVQRFLKRRGATDRRLKSRETAAPVLVRTLARLTREDLLGLVEETGSPGESDYSLLARAIMGETATRPQGLGETEEDGSDVPVSAGTEGGGRVG